MTQETSERTFDQKVRDRAVRLFSYLQELVQLRTPHASDIDNYEAVIWFSEVPASQDCYSISWGSALEDSELWLEVRKRKEPQCPTPPANCRKWIDPKELLNSAQEPKLLDRIFIPPPEPPGPETAPLVDSTREPRGSWDYLSTHIDVSASWDAYLAERWRPWAEAHRLWTEVHSLYGRLFSILQQIRTTGENFELMLGLGLLTWRTSAGRLVRRHVLTGQATAEFDANSGVLSVRAAADGVKLKLEMDMLEPSEWPDAETILTIERTIEHVAESPWDRPGVETILRTWVHSLHEDGAFDSTDDPSQSAAATPRLTYSPAIFLRKRTNRSLVASFRTIIDQLKSGEEVPPGIVTMLEVDAPDPEIVISEGSTQEDAPGAGPDIVHFPLPANEEQREIAEKIARAQGVLVQGPPGTGKSHTIANLICHLLAEGKRILVTSQTPRALKVLQDKIPTELKPLNVSLLGNDRDSLKGLENSVQGIIGRYQRWNSRHNKADIANLHEAVTSSKKKIATIDARLRELREKDTFEYSLSYGRYKGTALKISQEVSKLRPLCAWIPDQVQSDSNLPINLADLKRLLNDYRTLNSERAAELRQKAIATHDLPSVEDLAATVEMEKKAQAGCLPFEQASAEPTFRALCDTAPETRQRAAQCLKTFRNRLAAIERRNISWLPEASRAFLDGQHKAIRQLHETTQTALNGLSERAHRTHSIDIRMPAGADRRRLKADATDLKSHLSAGGSFGWGPFRKSVVKQSLYIVTDVTVGGRPCKTAELLDVLIFRLDTESAIDALWEIWKGKVGRSPGSLPIQVAHLTEHHDALSELLSLDSIITESKTTITQLPVTQEIRWSDPATVDRFIFLLDASLALDDYKLCADRIDSYGRMIRTASSYPNAHPSLRGALAAIEHRDIREWAAIIEQLEELERSRLEYEWRTKTENELSATAPLLTRKLQETAQDLDWDARVNSFEEAWYWARAAAWLTEYESEHDLDALTAERASSERTLSNDTAALAASKSWAHCFNRMTDEHRTYLEAWKKEIQNIGKGTGKYAETHRRTAQKYMSKCREAIPAWVMPFYRIAETVAPKKHCFDVAIVDEASQSGPEALMLQYLAKQIIIVGDDQQISPEDVGIDQSSVFALQRLYLHDFNLKETFGSGYSLFAQGELRYGHRIALREHFRCMPEIIRFSNDLCYSENPLVPLRQYPPDRLEPIVVRSVPEGFREGAGQSARNSPEAEALVDALCDCCTDPSYDDKTMGVISLQGDYQANIIQRLLKQRLGEQEMIRRGIVCGDAYAFQGDERDVIFMSLVAAPNERIGALTKLSDKRRFNVAASRARDQVWLFHTATLNDLSQEDLRFKLLSYYLSPFESPVGVPDWELCESQFERDVATRIHEKGFRILLQYEPFGHGGKRIDIMTEGEKNRLAVECDGDRWHGPDEYDRDMFRQRQLERAGLVFWRVRGSEFYRNQEAALEPLWHKLDKLGIQPWDGVRKPPKERDTIQEDELKTSRPRPIQYPLVEKPIRENLFTRTEPQGTKIGDVSRDLVRGALYECVPQGNLILREELLREVSKKLGFSKVGRNIRSTINRMIGAEVRAGRLGTDWQNVWRQVATASPPQPADQP